MAAARVAFVTTCKNRADHLKITLPQNLADNKRALFVVLNYGTEDDLVEYLDTEHRKDIEDGRVVLYSHLDTPVFRMAHAKNMAHRLGMKEGAEILVNLDADNRTNSGFDGYVERQFDRHGKDIFLSARMIPHVLPRGINGRMAVTKDAFVKSGGYDEDRFEGGWSSEDKEFNLRLRKLGYQDVEIPHFYLDALRHSNKKRFQQYPQMEHIAGDLLINTHNVFGKAVNNGSVGCGAVYRNFDFSTRIEIEPLVGAVRDSRVFGIGMHKTATTSLHAALEMLGYQSWHWSPAGELRPAQAAKAIWREVYNDGRSPTVERFTALGDLPIPLLYQKLDAAYPGSKFVLTVKDEDKWLDSVRKHWDPEFNPNRATWHLDPFTERAHNMLYGRKDFDGETFLARYRWHNAEVIEYFKHRPADLLVMNMDHGVGWFGLPEFLGRVVPDAPYPYINGNSR